MKKENKSSSYDMCNINIILSIILSKETNYELITYFELIKERQKVDSKYIRRASPRICMIRNKNIYKYGNTKIERVLMGVGHSNLAWAV